MHGLIGSLKNLDELHNSSKCKKVMEAATSIVKFMETIAKDSQKWVEGTIEWVYKEKIVKAKVVKEYFTLIVAQI